MEKNMQRGYLILCAMILSSPGIACADMVDYGSLQSLFGEPVTTSATGTPQRVSDVPVDMTIITADQIRQSGSRNIPQIIGEYVPGIDVFQSGLNSFDVGVRGYQQPFQPRLLVLVDGRQVFVDDYSRTIWDSIPVNIDDIRQIEVVKGASSALFGSNAAGGVVNIITYSPYYDHNNVAQVSIGTPREINEDATVSSKIGDKVGVKVSAGGMNADEFNTDHNPVDTQIDQPMHRYIAESSVFQITPDVQTNMEATYSQSQENPQQPGLNGRSAEDTDLYSLRGGFNWQTAYGLISNNTYFNYSDIDGHVAGASYPSATNLLVSQLQDQIKLNSDNTLRLAFEYRYKSYVSETLQALPQTPKFEENIFAPSATWLWQINDKLSWTNAARLDHQQQEQDGELFPGSFYSNANYSHDINALSANSGLVYKATDMDTLRASYGRGIQIPSFIEGNNNIIVGIGNNNYLDVEGNPYLKPTIVQDYELGYDRQIPKLYSVVKTAVFYELNRDLITFDGDQSTIHQFEGSTFILDQSDNSGSSHGFGGELEFQGHHKGFRWDASYSLSRVHDSMGALDTLDYDGSTPENHFRLSGGYTTGPWEFDGFGLAVTSLHMQSTVGNQEATGGYFSLTSRIGYKVTDNVTVALSGTNLTQARTTESPFPAIERQVFLSLSSHF